MLILHLSSHSQKRSYRMPELIRINISFFSLILILAVSLFAAFLMYRETTPPVSTPKKMILGFLRTITIMLTILVLFKPTVFLTFINEIPTKIAIFLDNSGSISEGTEGKKLLRTIDSLSVKLKASLNKHQLSLFTFNSELSELETDSIPVTKSATNFEIIFNLLNNSNFDHAVIVSDGNITEGNQGLVHEIKQNVPISVIGIGKQSSDVDILISDVNFRPTVYQNRSQQIIVNVSNYGSDGANTTVNQYLNGKLINSKTIDFKTENAEQSIEFINEVSGTGIQTYRFELAGMPGESNLLNNTRTIVQTVLKSKIRVGIFSAAPSYESKFLKTQLNTNPDYKIHAYTENTEGRFINVESESFMDSLDVIILDGYPGRFSKQNTLTRLASIAREKRPGIVQIVNKNISLQKMKPFPDLFPAGIKLRPVKSAEYQICQGDLKLNHPLLQLFDNPALNIRFWSGLPPIETDYVLTAKNGPMKSLLSAQQGGKSVRVISVGEFGPSKHILLKGNDFWRWHFLLQTDPEIDEGYFRLWSNMLRWVAHKEQLKPFMLKTAKNTFQLGEKIRINAHLFNARYEPVGNGTVKLKAQWGEQVFELEVQQDSLGYFADLWPPGAGRFAIAGVGEEEGI